MPPISDPTSPFVSVVTENINGELFNNSLGTLKGYFLQKENNIKKKKLNFYLQNRMKAC